MATKSRTETTAKIVTAARTGDLVTLAEAILHGGYTEEDLRAALRAAIRTGKEDAVLLLVWHDSEASRHREPCGKGLLHLSAARGWPRVTESLLSMHACPPDMQDGQGNTPLHYAVEHGHHEIARHLVRLGASALIANHAGETPEDLARRLGDDRMSEILALASPLTHPPSEEDVIADWSAHCDSDCIADCPHGDTKHANRPCVIRGWPHVLTQTLLRAIRIQLRTYARQARRQQWRARGASIPARTYFSGETRVPRDAWTMEVVYTTSMIPSVAIAMVVRHAEDTVSEAIWYLADDGEYVGEGTTALAAYRTMCQARNSARRHLTEGQRMHRERGA